MVWLFVIVLIVLIIFVPSFRVFSVGIAGLAVVGILLLWGYSSYSNNVALTKINPSEIVLSDLRTEKDYSTQKLYGRITNNSKYELSSLQLKFTYKDCETANGNNCVVIGEDDVYVSESVPGGQARDFDSYMKTPPIPKGFLNRTWAISSVRAR